MKAYKVVYWLAEAGKKEDSECFQSIDCLIDEKELDKLKQFRSPTMIEIIVNDGEKLFIHVANINRIEEVFAY